MQEELDYVAQLSTADGAVIVSNNLELVSFGATLQPPDMPKLEKVFWARPNDNHYDEIELQKLGGTRHQSACRWCASHPDDGIALVVSQDGAASLVFGTRDERRVIVVKPLGFENTDELVALSAPSGQSGVGG